MSQAGQSRGRDDLDLLRTIVEEVDEAREVYELAEQLERHLPLRTFDDVVKATGDRHAVVFRTNPIEVGQFAALVPATLFPIEDTTTLVALLYQAVRLAPSHIQYPESDVRNAKRRLRRMGLAGLPTGQIGKAPGPLLHTRPHGGTEQRQMTETET
jgi:hypothetical protein